MMFRDCKTRGVLFVFCLFFIFVSWGCGEKVTEKDDESLVNLSAGITRQEFYGQLYSEIMQNDLLRQVYLPVVTEKSGTEVLFGNTKFESGSYEEGLHLIKAENASHLSVETRNYSQGKNAVETRWSWRGTPYEQWKNLLSDYNEIDSKYIKAVLFFCENGLAELEEDRNTYSLKVNPKQEISLKEAKYLKNAVYSYKREIPLNAITTCDPDGNEILLCFSDIFSLFFFKNLTEHMIETDELLHSFVYFDVTGTVLSFWIQSKSGGTFAVPLDFAAGEICSFSYYTPGSLAVQRLDIISTLLPEKEKEDFITEASLFLQKNDTMHTLYYEIGKKSSKIMSVVFRPTDEHTGTVFLQCGENFKEV